ncbi:MoaD/ThiS family protein [Lutibacter sp. TH_r2]|uniref:MoaD/ThiS family protein n=1 Tax=Lutibacter sp. TH_r2 TaxID=3082083 RepID=UPI002953197E|nr:MoaD/ThiS family protein [Lutibacter sp. TH_r2]MDV7186254.1 MoaD/ThiS family protein [Lutibacter sp. TH_r2]
MKIKVLFFGITTDLTRETSVNLEIADRLTIKQLKLVLLNKYTKLTNLDEYAFAVNEEYAKENQILQTNDVVAIIPPVSGG